MSREFQKWEDFEKELNITKEQEIEIKLEMDLIREIIEARKKAKLSQSELSRKTGIKQPAIARFENGLHSPKIATLIRMLVPMGYGIKIVPLNNDNKKK